MGPREGLLPFERDFPSSPRAVRVVVDVVLAVVVDVAVAVVVSAPVVEWVASVLVVARLTLSAVVPPPHAARVAASTMATGKKTRTWFDCAKGGILHKRAKLRLRPAKGLLENPA